MSDEARRLIDEGWEHLQEEMASIPIDRLQDAGAVGDWSVKDLMAHLAFWDDRIVQHADARAVGKELEPIDWHAVNARETALRANWTLDESRREMEAAHERLLEAVSRHPDFEPEFWKDDTFGHYQEHLEDLRAWRREGSW